MAYPPPVLPINRSNADPQQNTHPNDHNALALGVNDITTKLGADPSGPAGTVQQRFTNIEAVTAIHGIRWYSTGQACAAPAATVLSIGTVAWDAFEGGSSGPLFAEGVGMRVQGAGVYTIHAGLTFDRAPSATSLAMITSDIQGTLSMSYLPVPNVEKSLGVSATMSLADQDRIIIQVYIAGIDAVYVAANVAMARIFK